MQARCLKLSQPLLIRNFYTSILFHNRNIMLYRCHGKEFFETQMADAFVSSHTNIMAKFIHLLAKDISNYDTAAKHKYVLDAIYNVINYKIPIYSPSETDTVVNAIHEIKAECPSFNKALKTIIDDYNQKPLPRKIEFYECKLITTGVDKELIDSISKLNPQAQLNKFAFALMYCKRNIGDLQNYFNLFYNKDGIDQVWLTSFAALIKYMPKEYIEKNENGINKQLLSHNKIYYTASLFNILSNYFPFVTNKKAFFQQLIKGVSPKYRHYGIGAIYLDMYNHIYQCNHQILYDLEFAVCSLNTQEVLKILSVLNYHPSNPFTLKFIQYALLSCSYIKPMPFPKCTFISDPLKHILPLLKVLFIKTIDSKYCDQILNYLSKNNSLASDNTIHKAIEEMLLSVENSLSALNIIHQNKLKIGVSLNSINTLLSHIKEINSLNDLEAINGVLTDDIYLRKAVFNHLSSIIKEYKTKNNISHQPIDDKLKELSNYVL